MSLSFMSFLILQINMKPNKPLDISLHYMHMALIVQPTG